MKKNISTHCRKMINASNLKSIATAWLLLICGSTMQLQAQTDWQAFMAKQDMVWTKLPTTWYEAPFMGNGSMGTYICREPGKNAIRVDVGNSMVHDRRASGMSIYKRCRLMIGHFLLEPVGEIASGKMRLDLWNAETTATIRTDKGEIRLAAIVTSESPYILVKAEGTEGEKDFKWQFCPDSHDSPRQLNAIAKKAHRHFMKDYVSNPPAQLSKHNGIDICWQPLLDGGGTATAWREYREGGKCTLIVTNAHSIPENTALQKAEEAVANLTAADVPVLWQQHRNWWHNYYPQSFVSLPDKKMENFYWAQMYKLACGTRVGGGLLDNCGPWLVPTPWPNAWWNLNVQLSYWPVYPSNRLELGMPLADAVRDNQQNLINNVPEQYRHNAAGLPVATGFDLAGSVLPEPGGGGKKHAQVGNLPWLCHNLWLHYRFSMDEDILRHTVYPTLRRAINYYLYFIDDDEQGNLHLRRTYSPEYGEAEDCNFDLALLRWGCQTLIKSAEILKVDDELLPRWQYVVEKLTDYPQNEQEGIMIGRDAPFAKTHRHYSHLLMFYPLYLLNAEQPGSRELMEKSVEHWHSFPGNILGYSYTGASSLYAAFGNGNKALENLRGLFSLTLRPNTMYKESGPVIETPLSGAQCIHDMLLQSWGGKIRLFPAMPDEWQDASFSDLRTEGAFLVSAVRRGGKTVMVRIKSLAGEPCVIRTDMEHPVIKAGQATLSRKAENEYELDLKKGETVTIAPRGMTVADIAPITGKGQNYFGLK